MTRRGPGRNAATQAERLLSYALAGHVLHQDDWYNRGADGGSAIKAVRSRISELEQDGGFGFHHTRRPDGTVEYRIAYVPERRAPAAAELAELELEALEACRAEDAAPRSLFEPEPPPAPAPAPTITKPGYADWDAAA